MGTASSPSFPRFAIKTRKVWGQGSLVGHPLRMVARETRDEASVGMRSLMTYREAEQQFSQFPGLV